MGNVGGNNYCSLCEFPEGIFTLSSAITIMGKET